ncbi:hypothetical protein GN109_10050 [Collimonas pratensis]|uniref:hypothetical protein n=1 Tax=Collimonas pratensis TaxID=279113 RepID=UPI00143DB983|nr:hypothetical protein [Collimonas pratensis]NKI69761.1 hypothetical protein [Collimonas pratensis]
MFYGLKGSGETGDNLLSYINICKERVGFKVASGKVMKNFLGAARSYTDLYVLIPYAQILTAAATRRHAICNTGVQKTSTVCDHLSVVPAWLAKQQALLRLICFGRTLRISRIAALPNGDIGENTDRNAASADHKK